MLGYYETAEKDAFDKLYDALHKPHVMNSIRQIDGVEYVLVPKSVVEDLLRPEGLEENADVPVEVVQTVGAGDTDPMPVDFKETFAPVPEVKEFIALENPYEDPKDESDVYEEYLEDAADKPVSDYDEEEEDLEVGAEIDRADARSD